MLSARIAERIHGVDERVYLPSVVQTAQVLALLVRDWCGLVMTRRRRGRCRASHEIRRFFRTATTPVYFVSATAFNLLGIDRWIPTFRYVNYYDSFDGYHPNVFVPRHHAPPTFESIEEICNYLLAHKEVHDFIGESGAGGKAVFLMFDEETERLAEEAGLEVAFPPAALRNAARLEDRDDAARRRGRRAERAERARPRRLLRRRCSSSRSARASARTSSCRRRTATPGRRRSSSPRASDWDEHADGARRPGAEGDEADRTAARPRSRASSPGTARSSGRS